MFTLNHPNLNKYGDSGIALFFRRAVYEECIFLQIVVSQACPEGPDPPTGPAGGVEIWALCEWRLAIAGVGAARLALVVGVDAMSISECHGMAWSMPGMRMAWDAGRYLGIIGASVFL